MNRTKIAVFGLLAIAVLSIFNLLLDVPAQTFPDITLFDSHVSRVRASLPPSGIIGYYTDFTDAPGGTDALREYYLMQYALAPMVVDKSLDQKLIITSLHNPQNPIRSRNLQLMQNFGSGVELLRNVTK